MPQYQTDFLPASSIVQVGSSVTAASYSPNAGNPYDLINPGGSWSNLGFNIDDLGFDNHMLRMPASSTVAGSVVTFTWSGYVNNLFNETEVTSIDKLEYKYFLVSGENDDSATTDDAKVDLTQILFPTYFTDFPAFNSFNTPVNPQYFQPDDEPENALISGDNDSINFVEKAFARFFPDSDGSNTEANNFVANIGFIKSYSKVRASNLENLINGIPAEDLFVPINERYNTNPGNPSAVDSTFNSFLSMQLNFRKDNNNSTTDILITRPPELRITYTAPGVAQEDSDPSTSRRIHILGNNRFRIKTNTNTRNTINDGAPYAKVSDLRFVGELNLLSGNTGLASHEAQDSNSIYSFVDFRFDVPNLAEAGTPTDINNIDSIISLTIKYRTKTDNVSGLSSYQLTFFMRNSNNATETFGVHSDIHTNSSYENFEKEILASTNPDFFTVNRIWSNQFRVGFFRLSSQLTYTVPTNTLMDPPPGNNVDTSLQKLDTISYDNSAGNSGPRIQLKYKTLDGFTRTLITPAI